MASISAEMLARSGAYREPNGLLLALTCTMPYRTIVNGWMAAEETFRAAVGAVKIRMSAVVKVPRPGRPLGSAPSDVARRSGVDVLISHAG